MRVKILFFVAALAIAAAQKLVGESLDERERASVDEHPRGGAARATRGAIREHAKHSYAPETKGTGRCSSCRRASRA